MIKFDDQNPVVRYSGDIRVDSLIGFSALLNQPSFTKLYIDSENPSIQSTRVYNGVDQNLVKTYSFNDRPQGEYWDLWMKNEGGKLEYIHEFNAVWKDYARKLMAQAELITGIKFVETSNAKADFSLVSIDYPGVAQWWGKALNRSISLENYWVTDSNTVDRYITSDTMTGVVQISYDYVHNTQEKYGRSSESAARSALGHEIGHALGLGHPFEDGDSNNIYFLPTDLNGDWNTLMSYTGQKKPGTIFVDWTVPNWDFQEFDVRALHWIYGGDGYGGEFGYVSSKGPGLLDSVYFGENFKNIIGSNGVDWMLAGAGNNLLNGGAGSDFMIGSEATISTSYYENVRSKYTITYKVSLADAIAAHVDGTSTGEGVDTLRDIQRLRFSDTMWALDVKANEHAGQAVLLMGAVLGTQSIKQQPATLGQVLSILDNGTSLASLCAAVAAMPELATAAGGADNKHIAAYLLTNVMGKAPDAKLLSAADQYITDVGLANTLNFITMHAVNQTHVDLVGLSSTGIGYFSLE